jgi:hypothetical protein
MEMGGEDDVIITLPFSLISVPTLPHFALRYFTVFCSRRMARCHACLLATVASWSSYMNPGDTSWCLRDQ